MEVEKFILYVVKNLVKFPDDVEISKTMESEKVAILNLTCNEEDLGRVIGKCGNIINSIRTLVKSLSKKDQIKYVIKVGK